MSTATEVPIVIWHGAYEGGWRDLITPSSFAHPAKMARGLVVRIFNELFAMGALRAGDLVCDPFAGIGSTGIESAARGCRFIGCELQPTFVAFARENFELHRRDWQDMGRPLPVVLQSDSRHLTSILEQADCGKFKRQSGDSQMAEGSIDAVVSSPPYAAQDLGGGDGQRKFGGNKTPEECKATKNGKGLHGNYGHHEGQLGALPEGSIDAVVGSSSAGAANVRSIALQNALEQPQPHGNEIIESSDDASTFWEAAHAIVAESFAILKPGGVAVWVVKHFVRKGQLVDFPGDWRKLCEHVGFETVMEVHASLVETWEENHLFDGVQQKERKWASFFRRLAEKKGSPKIDFETVLFMIRP